MLGLGRRGHNPGVMGLVEKRAHPDQEFGVTRHPELRETRREGSGCWGKADSGPPGGLGDKGHQEREGQGSTRSLGLGCTDKSGKEVEGSQRRSGSKFAAGSRVRVRRGTGSRRGAASNFARRKRGWRGGIQGRGAGRGRDARRAGPDGGRRRAPPAPGDPGPSGSRPGTRGARGRAGQSALGRARVAAGPGRGSRPDASPRTRVRPGGARGASVSPNL